MWIRSILLCGILPILSAAVQTNSLEHDVITQETDSSKPLVTDLNHQVTVTITITTIHSQPEPYTTTNIIVGNPSATTHQQLLGRTLVPQVERDPQTTVYWSSMTSPTSRATPPLDDLSWKTRIISGNLEEQKSIVSSIFAEASSRAEYAMYESVQAVYPSNNALASAASYHSELASSESAFAAQASARINEVLSDGKGGNESSATSSDSMFAIGTSFVAAGCCLVLALFL